jgi:hypothetical protein
MSIKYEVPKSTRLIQAKVTATANFNVAPSFGMYNFALTSAVPVQNNYGLLLYNILPNHLYFLERVNVGANIPEADYEDSIIEVPTARYRTSAENSIIFPQPLPLVNYVQNQELNTFVWTEKTNDSIVVDVAGILIQTSNLVGENFISINMSFNLYDITDTGYISTFKGAMSGGKIGAVIPHAVASNTFFTKD